MKHGNALARLRGLSVHNLDKSKRPMFYRVGMAKITIRSIMSSDWVYVVIRALLAVSIAFLLNEFPFYSIESFSYDMRVRLKPNPKPTGHIALVSIDKSTHSTMNREPDIVDHRELLKVIGRDRPRAIVYLFPPNLIRGTNDDIKKWLETADNIPNLIFASQEIVSKGNEDRIRLPPPFHNLLTIQGPLSTDYNKFAEDNVSRRVLIEVDGLYTVQAQLAQMYNGLIKPEQYRGAFEFLNSWQAYSDFARAGTYKSNSFFSVVNYQFPVGTFTDKIVLIGKETLELDSDYVRTPYSREIVAMSKLEAHANAIDTLIRNSGPVRTPWSINFVLTSIISLITVFAVWRMRPTTGIIVLSLTTLGYLVLAQCLFSAVHVWIPVAQPILAVFICYYFFIPYRLIVENRRSWEYYQKNKILTQVEELKTNFLSLMSHDLKTPLARIQGMADIVLQNPDHLSTQQTDALKTITKSSEELTYFISSILSLSRVESEAIKLNLSTKDLNALIDEIVQRYEPIAKEKDIQIFTELEPIFSFKMDVDLMRQVVSNLVENAIKYSSKNSKILISTEEFNSQVILQVADQGIGIPNAELPNIFMKFYRSSEAKNSSVKGSGLGLYLAKYFVQLHNGEIHVESEHQQGSTFTIKLPMEI